MIISRVPRTRARYARTLRKHLFHLCHLCLVRLCCPFSLLPRRKVTKFLGYMQVFAPQIHGTKRNVSLSVSPISQKDGPTASDRRWGRYYLHSGFRADGYRSRSSLKVHIQLFAQVGCVGRLIGIAAYFAAYAEHALHLQLHDFHFGRHILLFHFKTSFLPL